MDPHLQYFGPDRKAHRHIFEGLLALDEHQRLQPALAQSWRPVDDRLWEFKLRPGVLWHDGAPFTADDVGFSMQRAPNVPGGASPLGAFTQFVERVETPDALTVLVHTKRVAPLAPNELANIFIVSRRHADGATTADFNQGAIVIGTGPYRFVSWTKGSALRLRSFDQHWAGRPDWATVRMDVIGDDNARLAALTSGAADIADQVPPSQIARLHQTSTLSWWTARHLAMADVALIPQFFPKVSWGYQNTISSRSTRTNTPRRCKRVRCDRSQRRMTGLTDRVVCAKPPRRIAPRAMIVAAQPEAVEAGADTLRSGGNALDAVIACALAQGVVDPMRCGIGGFGVLHVFDPVSGAHFGSLEGAADPQRDGYAAALELGCKRRSSERCRSTCSAADVCWTPVRARCGTGSKSWSRTGRCRKCPTGRSSPPLQRSWRSKGGPSCRA